MTERNARAGARRQPQAFDTTDPAIVVEPAEPSVAGGIAGAAGSEAGIAGSGIAAPAGTAAQQALRPGWISLLVGALIGLALLAASLSFAHFVSVVLRRGDWIGLVGWALVVVAGVAAAVLAIREIVGLVRLGRLAHLRREAEAALRSGNVELERALVRRLRRTLVARPDLAWAAARFADHEAGVHDPGDLLALADRELMTPLDAAARRLILASAKRVSVVTALSPMAAIAVGFVLVENLRLLRRLATLYGGRPGFIGGLRLARMVVTHILATGGLALTDDLFGQFIGQDLARRVSRRLGEGLFNGALTARIGVAALEVCRPLPFVAARPIRIRDILAELTRRTPK